MAFEQVRNRSSLFRPWAFGDSHSSKVQKKLFINPNTATTVSSLSTSVDTEEPKKISTVEDDLSCLKNFLPSSFPSTQTELSINSNTVTILPTSKSADEPKKIFSDKDDLSCLKNFLPSSFPSTKTELSINSNTVTILPTSKPTDEPKQIFSDKDDLSCLKTFMPSNFPSIQTELSINSNTVTTVPTSKSTDEPNKIFCDEDDLSCLKTFLPSTSRQPSPNLVPSAFRSTGVLPRTLPIVSLKERLTDLSQSSFSVAGTVVPRTVNVIHDNHHIPEIPSSESILIPSMVNAKAAVTASSLWGDLVPEIPFPVPPYISHLLEQTNSKLKVKKQRPKLFQCPHCQVSFSNNGQLKGHIRIHTGERPFVCNHANCGKSFTRNEELTRHLRIHSGCRPHQCVFCNKRFGRKDHLKKHVKTHQRTNVVRLPIGAFQGLSYFVGDCISWF